MRVVRYPVRVGYVVGETFAGKRTFVSDPGFFQTTDDSAVADQRTSVPQGRGQRTSIR